MPSAKVLYIHGAGPQPEAGVLRREIDEILFPDEADPPSDIAWFADVTDAAHEADEAAREARDGQNAGPGVDTGDAVGDDERPGLDDRLLGRARTLWTGTLGLASGGGRGALLLRLVAAMGSVDARESVENRHGSRAEALWHFYRDVAGYLENDGDIAPVLRERVRAAVTRNPDLQLVVAHSLGTVIAFDVLAEPQLAGRELTLVTVGSPLGLGPLQDRLAAWAGARPVAIPPTVTRWRNFHAHGDPVATGSDIDGLHADYHPTARVHSTMVRNDVGHHHGFLGYLRTPEVLDAIYATLGVRRP